MATSDDSCQAPSTVMCGSKPTTRMPSACAALATFTPIAPRPTTPSVLPASSLPTKRFFSASTLWCRSSPGSRPRTKASASAMLRAASSMPATTSSLTALAFAPGALNTGTPRADSSATGMLLVPAPARATAFTLAAIGLLCMSAERTSTASGSATSLAVAYRAVGRRSRPLREMLLRVWMVNMGGPGLGNGDGGFRKKPVLRRTGTRRRDEADRRWLSRCAARSPS